MNGKNLLLAAFLLGMTMTAVAQGKIEVKVKNIKSEKGSVRVGLFNSEDSFLKKPIDGKVVKVSGKEVTVVFDNLQPGDYAVSVIHDENENEELDKNFVGMPSEGFAFGNNAMGAFGPPGFDKAKVTVKTEKVMQEISLKHM